MYSQPVISIVVPVYNVEKYVRACLQSIITQSFTNFEVIMVDDGSTDNSATICADFCEEDCRFKLVHKENGGLSSARNYGLNIASGQYVIFFDSDDTVDARALEILVSHFSENVDVVCCGVRRIRANGEAVDTFICGCDAPVSPHDALESMLTFKGVQVGAYSKMVRRSLIEENDIHFVEGEINEDLLYTTKVLLASHNTFITGIPLYNYFERPGSITTRPMSTEQMVVIKNMALMRQLVLSKYPDLEPSVNEYASVDLWTVARGASGRNFRKSHRSESDYARSSFFENTAVARLAMTRSLKDFIAFILVKYDLYKYLKE